MPIYFVHQILYGYINKSVDLPGNYQLLSQTKIVNNGVLESVLLL